MTKHNLYSAQKSMSCTSRWGGGLYQLSVPVSCNDPFWVDLIHPKKINCSSLGNIDVALAFPKLQTMIYHRG